MARMRELLTSSESVQLINSMIAGTQAQIDLITFKSKSLFGEDRSVGVGYWNGFLKRNGHLICSKRGAKYELDRSKRTT